MKLAGHPATEAKHMNNWLNRLERKYGRYGIPNLTNILVALQTFPLTCGAPVRYTRAQMPCKFLTEGNFNL